MCMRRRRNSIGGNGSWGVSFRRLCHNRRRHIVPLRMAAIGTGRNPATGAHQTVLACPGCDYREGWERDAFTAGVRRAWAGLHSGRHVLK